jgi:hypothetical protein
MRTTGLPEEAALIEAQVLNGESLEDRLERQTSPGNKNLLFPEAGFV